MQLTDDFLTRVLKWESGYVNDPQDKGGETIFGISRRYWPQLSLWAAVDELKSKSLLNKVSEEMLKSKFKNEIRMVYQVYANVVDSKLDNLYQRFDFAVNAGTKNYLKLANSSDFKASVIAYYRGLANKYPYWRRNWQLRLRKTWTDNTITL